MSEVKEDTGLTLIGTFSEIVKRNRPVIQEKGKAALGALATVTAITTDEEDEFANGLLVKCAATVAVMEPLRKEYTAELNKILDDEIQLENKVKEEMKRVKLLRDERLRAKAKKKAEDDAAAEKEKVKLIEIKRVKNEIVAGVQLGIATRVLEGEAAISKLIAEMTLETFDQVVATIKGIKPSLKEDKFKSWLVVPYDQKLITVDEYAKIMNDAFVSFDFNKQNATYQDVIKKMLEKWIAFLPSKKDDLIKLSKMGVEEAEKAKAAAADKIAHEESERVRMAEEQKAEVQSETQRKIQNDTVEVEFDHQVRAQTTTFSAPSGTRTVNKYRFDDDERIIKDPEYVLRVLMQVAAQVLSDKDNLGIIERDSKSKLPKYKDDKTVKYVDGVQYWFDQFAKLPSRQRVEGVKRVDVLSTVAKKTK